MVWGELEIVHLYVYALNASHEQEVLIENIRTTKRTIGLQPFLVLSIFAPPSLWLIIDFG